MEVEHRWQDIEEDVEKRNVYTYIRRKAECSTLQQASLPTVRRTHKGCLLEDSDGQLFYGYIHDEDNKHTNQPHSGLQERQELP